MAKIKVENTEITVSNVNGEDYICITDMLVTLWNFLVFGNVYIIPILIMANSPQLETSQD